MSTTTTNIDFIVNRANLSESEFVESDGAPLADGEVRFAVEKFALTSNNITYGVAGDMLNYWQFFPAKEGWGRIPVWAIGRVIESKHDGFNEGDRYYGYFPMSTTLTVTPDRVSERGFYDGAKHREGLAATYNQYTKVSPENGIIPQYEDHSMLYRPLFATSFLIDDWLADNDFFGAKTLVLSSASSKTTIGLAFQASLREGLTIIGLTSPGNVNFVNSLGLYDSVLTYDDITTIPNDMPTAYVDMAGNGTVRAAMHNHFTDQLKVSSAVGITHWQNFGQQADLPGPAPQMFFAPDQIQKRAKDLGAQEFQMLIGQALIKMYAYADQHLDIVQRKGQAALQSTYTEMLAGHINPKEGYILSVQTGDMVYRLARRHG